ncbi:MAG: glycosyltransferase [Nitrospiraceae bacterium]|nr:MAG: glycosyltransferase [Nitrospiraceae bacterium]
MSNDLTSIAAVENEEPLVQAKEKVRVLIVGPASPSTGGIPSYIDELLASGLNNKYEFNLLDPLIVKRRTGKQESHLSSEEIIASLRVLWTFVKSVRALNPSLIHIHTSSFWGFYEKAIMLFIAQKIFGKKVILHIHGGQFDLFYRRSRCRKLIDKIIRWADKALIVSKQFKEVIDKDCLVHVDNSVRFRKEWRPVEKETLRKKYGIDPHKTLFLSLAILEKRKGIYETLEVFRRISARRDDFVYIIAGEGQEKERLEKFIEDNGLIDSIKMFDFVSGPKKEELFLLSDIFILNSSGESFGVSLIEAVSYGLFVITTPVGVASDAEDVFNDGNCIRVGTGDAKGLEKAILSVLDRKVNIDEVAVRNFYDFRKRFDAVPVFEKMRLIYDEVISA